MQKAGLTSFEVDQAPLAEFQNAAVLGLVCSTQSIGLKVIDLRLNPITGLAESHKQTWPPGSNHICLCDYVLPGKELSTIGQTRIFYNYTSKLNVMWHMQNLPHECPIC